jgi:hypothetical protein
VTLANLVPFHLQTLFLTAFHMRPAEADFLVRLHPEPCLILSRAQIHALLCSSKSKFIPA